MSTATDRSAWYAESLQQIDQALYGNAVQFPVPIEVGDQTYQFSMWCDEQLPDRLLSFDTETAAIKGNEVPRLALAAVHGDLGSSSFIHPADLPRFIEQHSQAYWCCHNAAFDFWVTAQALQAHPQALATWWDITGDGRLLCTMLLDSLIRLARTDEEPINRDLGTVSFEYCGLRLNKDDPYRLRYGELIDMPATEWPDTELGFWTYAAADPIATLQLAQRQCAISRDLIDPYRSELLSDVVRRFGPLTGCLQVQGAVALDYISRMGVQIDLAQAGQVHDQIASLVERHRQQLEQLGGEELFKRYGPRSKQAGQLQRTVAGVPRRHAKAIKTQLQRIAKASPVSIRPPRLKDGSCTDAVKYWSQHRDLHPFIDAYVCYSEQAKLAQFFQNLDTERIYPQYRPLVRTGRTSCSRPNLQQLPRDARFREMIVAPPGYWLLQIDYSVLELRTLAQICLRRYGRSVLADLFRQGVDPHQYTAALLLGETLEQFVERPTAERKQHRQRAKAVNFGVPGGLGAASLVAYSKQSYGVEMEIAQARIFRTRLVKQVYPELDAYLADNQLTDIAQNLHTSEARVGQALPRRQQIQIATRVVSGFDATPGGETYQPDLIAHLWLTLQQLNCNPELEEDLAAHRTGSTLMRRIFHGNAVTISGRLRGHVGFSQAANTPFQGLAADGNKLAMFRLLRAGYQLCGFVHDEMLVLIPDGTDYDAAVAHVEQIMTDAMREFTPDVPITTSGLLADRWYKDVDDQPVDQEGRIIPYRGAG
jgi:hypothetical protein